jgi:hypothetical protein
LKILPQNRRMIYIICNNVEMKMKHSKNVFTQLILLCTLASYLGLIFPANAAGSVNTLTHSGWLDSVGYYHVSGEVQNVGDGAVRFVKITATFYDSNSIVIAVDFTYTALSVILAGRKSPFEILLIDTGQALKVHHYSLSVTYSVTSPIPMGLEMLSHSSYIDGVGYMHVVGEIKNVETSTATFVKIIATFYNSSGHVVATDFTYSDPHDIDPNQTAPFQLLLIYANRVPLIASYALTAESNQYALVSEFPSFLTLSLLLMVILLAVVVHKRKHS